MERQLVRLTREDRWLLARRYEFHGNSVATLAKTLVREADGVGAVRRLRALRRIERRFGLDLGLLCHKVKRCRERRPHPLERLVINYVTLPSSEDEVILDVERIREVNRLIEKGVKHDYA